MGAPRNIAEVSYDIPNVAANVDYINVMTYDFHSSSDDVLGHNAPLIGSDKNTVNGAINYWIQTGKLTYLYIYSVYMHV